MKKNLLLVLVCVLLPWALHAQNTVVRKVSGFNKLSVYGDIVIYIIKGKTESLEIEIPDEIAPNKITTLVEEKELKIKSSAGLLSNKKKIKAYLTYKDLIALTAGGSAEIEAPDSVIKTDRLVLSAYTGATMDLTVDVKYIVAEVSENAVISIDGFTNNEEVTSSTGGVYSAFDLEAEDATVKAVTKGFAKIHSTMSLNATATSGGWIGYMGEPKYKFFTPKLGGKIEKVEEEKKGF